MMRSLLKKWRANPFDRIVKNSLKEGRRRFLVVWNRGLGDIPLGLYALSERLHQIYPEAQLTFLTRPDLVDGFKLLAKGKVLSIPTWKRGEPLAIELGLASLGHKREEFDIILEKVDPSRWFSWQIGKLTPKLHYDPAWDAYADRFYLDPKKKHIGIHFQTETSGFYSYCKDWPQERWMELFELMAPRLQGKILLFGLKKDSDLTSERILDLRGQTTLFEMFSLIKNRCKTVIAPDSGILSLIYYINTPFQLQLVSFWADPRQGILKQNVPSPNPHLVHIPLIAPLGQLEHLLASQVFQNILF